MLSKKGTLLTIALFVVAVLLTGEARQRMDRITEDLADGFRQLLYLPRGETLKIVACGFEAPLADALFIKGLVFYADSLAGVSKETRSYSYALFDVITDLSPRFHRAYQIGNNLLAGSADLNANLDGVRLLEKGVAFWDDLEKKGEATDPDPRWMFHVGQAVSYRLGIQSKRLALGDIDGAAEAREKSMKEFHLAANSPGAPIIVKLAATGLQKISRGGGSVEESTLAEHEVLTGLYESAVESGDKEVAEDMVEQLEITTKLLTDIRETRGAETAFSSVGRQFLAREGRPPEGLSELKKAGLLRTIPEKLPFDTEDEPDILLPMPDGSFLSRKLALMETAQYAQVMTDAASTYRRAHGSTPSDLQELLAEKLLDFIPDPPLAAIGQRFEYNPERGRVTSVMPYGPDLPPDRR